MGSIRIGKSGPLKGEIEAPGDKSITHRAILFGGMARGKTVIKGYLPSEDCICTLHAMEAMGVKSENKKDVLILLGEGIGGLTESGRILDMGNSGTSLRLLTGLLSGLPFFSVLDGDASLRNRPMGRVIEPLSRMGAEIRGRKGNRYAPIAVCGTSTLKGIEYRLPVASAQVKSALLLAGLNADGWTRLEEPDHSRDHSERMLKSFGAEIDFSEGRAAIRRSELKGMEIEVPGDFSSAAFFIAGATLVRGSQLMIRNVGINPTRTGLLDVLGRMGGAVTIENRRDCGGEPVGDLMVRSVDTLRGVTIAGREIPSMIDELPIIFVLCAFASGKSEISGAGELRVKESDRIGIMAREMRKLGVHVEERTDGLAIEGGSRLRGSSFSSEGDHRVAMSMAISALVAEGESYIEGTDCINTSFPGFEPLLRSVARD